MRHVKRIFTLLCMMLPMVAMADEVKVVYMTVTTTTGKTVEASVTEKEGVELPRFYTEDGTIKINSVVYRKSEIASIRFSIKTEIVDGIQETGADAFADKPSDVYTLDGKLVKTGYRSGDELPKGIYIINKKKIVIQ